MDNDANRSHTTVPPRPSQVPRPVRPTLGATEAAQTARQHMMAQHRSDYRRAAAPVQSAPPAGRAPAAPAKATPVQPVAQVRTASQPQVSPQPAIAPQPPVTKPVVPAAKAPKTQPKPKPRPKAMPAAASGMQAPAAAQSLQPVQPHRVTYKKTPGMVQPQPQANVQVAKPAAAMPTGQPVVPPPFDTSALETPLAAHPVKKPRRVGRTIAIVAGVIITILVVAVIAVFMWYTSNLQAVDASSNERVRVTVAKGASTDQVANTLVNQGLIRNKDAFKIYHRLNGKNGLKSGVYLIDKKSDVPAILAKLEAGKVDEFSVTFLPGSTVYDATKAMVQHGYKEEDVKQALVAAYDNPIVQSRPAGATIEGFILGETYKFYTGTTPHQVFEHTAKELTDYIKKENLEEKFKAQGLSVYQAIVLASIVQKEENKAADMPMVAGVFLNRLKKDMPLGSDVTAKYGVILQGNHDSKVVDAVSVDTPHNTRIHKGLPPTPIASPGFTALKAVAEPSKTDYLYFVAGDDGKTYYAKTTQEHERNAAQHCQKLCQL